MSLSPPKKSYRSNCENIEDNSDDESKSTTAELLYSQSEDDEKTKLKNFKKVTFSNKNVDNILFESQSTTYTTTESDAKTDKDSNNSVDILLRDAIPTLFVGTVGIPADSKAPKLLDTYFYVCLGDILMSNTEGYKLSKHYCCFYSDNKFVAYQSTMKGFIDSSTVCIVLYVICDQNSQVYLAYTTDSLSSSDKDISIEHVLLSRVLSCVTTVFGPLAFDTQSEFEQLVDRAAALALQELSKGNLWYELYSTCSL